jgi:hypothetical protein
MVCHTPDRADGGDAVPAPDFYTVEEAADILRIGRTAAYQAAKEYRQTGGAGGLPVIAIRGSLRVPRRLLEAMAGGPLDPADEPTVAVLDERRAANAQRATRPKHRQPQRSAAADAVEQRPLPFTR